MRAHGTYACYTIDRCRCPNCRQANKDYEKRRVRRKAYGTFPWVSPETAREHLEELLENGATVKAAARASGVSRNTVTAILSGVSKSDGTTRPLTRIHRNTERRILELTASKTSPLNTVLAKTTWEQLDEMIAFGIPKSRIALALGKKSSALQLSRDRITDENARRVDDLHWTLWKNHLPFRAMCECPLPTEMQRDLESADT